MIRVGLSCKSAADSPLVLYEIVHLDHDIHAADPTCQPEEPSSDRHLKAKQLRYPNADTYAAHDFAFIHGNLVSRHVFTRLAPAPASASRYRGKPCSRTEGSMDLRRVQDRHGAGGYGQPLDCSVLVSLQCGAHRSAGMCIDP